MSPPDDTPLAARLARWSDWWFTPRWRALLTWFGLTAVTTAVYYANPGQFFDLTQQPIVYLNRLLPAPLPPVFNVIAGGLTILLLLIWFQPLALRLSFSRGLAWIGLRLIAQILWHFLYNSGYKSNSTFYVVQGGSAALQCWVLWGWRSRPWICLPAHVTANALLIIIPLLHLELPYGVKWAASQLPNAVLLLYGTRLLRPDERAPSTTAN